VSFRADDESLNALCCTRDGKFKEGWPHYRGDAVQCGFFNLACERLERARSSRSVLHIDLYPWVVAAAWIIVWSWRHTSTKIEHTGQAARTDVDGIAYNE
jgi:hypothetical protein